MNRDMDRSLIDESMDTEDTSCSIQSTLRRARRPTAIYTPRPLPPLPEPLVSSPPLLQRRSPRPSTGVSAVHTSEVVVRDNHYEYDDDQSDETQEEKEETHMAANNNTFPSLDTSFSNRNLNSSPVGSVGGGSQSGGSNGSAAMSSGGGGATGNYMPPLPVGHQQDLNYLYAQIQELSGLLQANRNKVNDITRSAEEVARRANSVNGTSEHENDHEADKARIRSLEHELAKSNKVVDLYKHEQTENTKLIAMYEDALGTATDQIRNYCNDIDSRFLGQRRHYNNLLQAEKDEHLQSRLDRDHWHAQTLKLAEMIRTAYRLRCDEWGDEYRIIAGLQTEVRCLRRCLGIEAENPEDETGWEYLKDAPLNDQA